MENSLKNLTARAEEAALLNELTHQELNSVSVAQKPTQPHENNPVRPAPLKYMVVAFSVGLLAAVTVAVASMMFARPDRGFLVKAFAVAPVTRSARTKQT